MTKQEQIEKLTKAIRQVQMENLSQATSVHACAPQIAEALLKEGNVVALPCNIGDKFWWIYRSPFGDKMVQEEKVASIVVMKNGRFLLRTSDDCFWEMYEVYFSLEEACKALEELENGR